ncbi:uncharacterized protein LOC122055225 [Zingiber officinale]|uniref:uncharacterized protein LOC122055225 n=1 Tax=Zingiber officinale TaxID=94328 RepID=UPI001C4D8EE7|nr:uncharacterized protein LOC122055225 [Zingiber officinale]
MVNIFFIFACEAKLITSVIKRWHIPVSFLTSASFFFFPPFIFLSPCDSPSSAPSPCRQPRLRLAILRSRCLAVRFSKLRSHKRFSAVAPCLAVTSSFIVPSTADGPRPQPSLAKLGFPHTYLAVRFSKLRSHNNLAAPSLAATSSFIVPPTAAGPRPQPSLAKLGFPHTYLAAMKLPCRCCFIFSGLILLLITGTRQKWKKIELMIRNTFPKLQMIESQKLGWNFHH